MRSEIEPVSDSYSKQVYRTSVYLKDGTYLPCVIFRKASDIVDLAIHRLRETRWKWYLHKSVGYRAMVKSFVTRGNRVNSYDILNIEKSPYAIPTNCRNILCSAGETSMGWLSFIGIMNDEKEFWFGTPFSFVFFDMPEGYNADQMIDVIPHKSLQEQCFKNKPYFECFIDI